MFNRKGNRVKSIFTGVNRFYTYRYTYEMWKRHNPQGTYDEWETCFLPDHVFGYVQLIEQALESQGIGTKDMTVMIATIGEDYLRWLDEQEMEDNPENMGKYLHTLSEEDMYELMKKEKMDRNYGIRYLQISLLFPKTADQKTSYRLPEQTRQNLTKYLSAIYQNASVYIPGYILTAEGINRNWYHLIGIAKSYFDDGQKVRVGNMDEQIYANNDVSIGSLYIPILLFETVKSASVPIKTPQIPERYRVLLDEEGFKLFGITDVTPFAETKLAKEIRTLFEANEVSVCDTIVADEDIAEIEQILTEAEKKIKEAKKEISAKA